MLKTIRLELARTREFPNGSPERGYVLHAPLTADGHLDAEAYRSVKAQCKVRRFWAGEDDREGELIHTRGRKWAISYEPGDEDDEPFFKLDQHRFQAGDYVTVSEADGEAHTFRVASVK